MARRPSLQFYPADWMGNANLMRCSHEEQGVWINVMCLMHNSPEEAEYGILRWPLGEIGQAVHCKVSVLASLVKKGVLKGANLGEMCEAFIYTPRSGHKNGAPVVLIQPQPGPLWYSSRMVKDEYVRQHAGASTRFKAEGGTVPDDVPPPNPPPSHSPSQRQGERQGDGSSFTSSSSSFNPLLRSDSDPFQGGDSVLVGKAKQEPKPKKPKPADQTPEEILGGGKGTPVWESYWKLVATFGGMPKNPAPKTTARLYVNALNAGRSAEQIQALAQELRNATSDVKYMLSLNNWLTGGGYLTPELPKASAPRPVKANSRATEADASFLEQLQAMEGREAS